MKLTVYIFHEKAQKAQKNVAVGGIFWQDDRMKTDDKKNKVKSEWFIVILLSCQKRAIGLMLSDVWD